jgi:hypothetical protein
VKSTPEALPATLSERGERRGCTNPNSAVSPPKSSNYVGKIALPVFDGAPSDVLCVCVLGGGPVFLVPGAKIVGRTQIEWRLFFDSAVRRDVTYEQEFSSLYAPWVVAVAASSLF